MAEIGSDLFFSTIAQWNALLASRQISAGELARAVISRLAQLGPRYNAVALVLEQQAIRKAEEVDKDLKRGRLRGPLQGIPYGAKDLLSYAGQPTTWGARPYAAQVFDYDATVITRLASVGAVLAAKLATVELAGGGGYRYASASLQGPGLNPWDRTRWSGGSSSGPAAAVAAGSNIRVRSTHPSRAGHAPSGVRGTPRASARSWVRSTGRHRPARSGGAPPELQAPRE